MKNLSKIADSLEATLEGVSEAFKLITDLGVPNLGESLTDIHTRLLVTRSVMSNVSDTASKLVRLRASVRQEQIDREGALEDKEAAVLSEPEKPSFVEDYSSAKERNAKLGAKTLEERILVREAKKVYIDVDSAYEYVRNRLWELDRSVRDIDTRLRVISYEPNDF